METLQTRLKKIRKEKKFTQDELAKRAYLSKNTISNIERGITKKLKSHEIELLSNALMVTEDYLKGTTNESDKNKDGLIQAIYVLPNWNWQVEIKEVLKKHSCNRVIETILRDCVYFLGQLGIENPNYYRNTKVTILEKTLELLNSKDFTDQKLLNGFLDLLHENQGNTRRD